MSSSRVDVAVIAAGWPQSSEELPAYLTYCNGVAPDLATLRAATDRLASVGGPVSTAVVTARLAAGLQTKLGDELGAPARVGHGFLCGSPSVADCLAQLDGERIVALSLTPFASRLTVDRYRCALKEAEAPEHGGRGRGIPLLDGWCTDRAFARAVSRRVAESLDGCFASEWALLFVTRSVPVDEIDGGDPVLDQLQQAISQILPAIAPGGWGIGCVGKGPSGRWLEPEPDEAVRQLAGEGWNKVLVVPIGFVAEELETRYDLDVLLRRQATALGLTYRLARTQDDSPAFVATLADVVVRHLAPWSSDHSPDQSPADTSAALQP